MGRRIPIEQSILTKHSPLSQEGGRGNMPQERSMYKKVLDICIISLAINNMLGPIFQKEGNSILFLWRK